MRALSDPFRRARAVIVAGSIAVAVAACGATGPSAPAQSPACGANDPSSPAQSPGCVAIDPSEAVPSSIQSASLAPVSAAPEPTAVPGGQTVEPGPVETHKPTTTKTDWGVILDSVPEDFPQYPGAKVVDSPDEPVSAAYEAKATVDEVARWYRKATEEAAWSTLDLSDPLEDGSRVLDSQGDLPECQVQTTFRPEGDSTLITVLYAAGCIALGG